jgi:hypothetical protein
VPHDSAVATVAARYKTACNEQAIDNTNKTNRRFVVSPFSGGGPR